MARDAEGLTLNPFHPKDLWGTKRGPRRKGPQARARRALKREHRATRHTHGLSLKQWLRTITDRLGMKALRS